MLDFAAPLGFTDGVGNDFAATGDASMAMPNVFLVFLVVVIIVVQVVGIRILFIEIRKWITYVLEDDLWRDVAKLEVMHGDGLDEARKRDGLKFGVDEVTDAFGQSVAVWPAGQCFPVEVY